MVAKIADIEITVTASEMKLAAGTKSNQSAATAIQYHCAMISRIRLYIQVIRVPQLRFHRGSKGKTEILWTALGSLSSATTSIAEVVSCEAV